MKAITGSRRILFAQRKVINKLLETLIKNTERVQRQNGENAQLVECERERERKEGTKISKVRI